MDLSKYAALFQAESEEHLRACNRLLLEWERDLAASEPVDGLFRAIHTIKGMAATMGYQGVADLAHHAENLLDALRAGRVPPSQTALDTLFRASDALSHGLEAAAQAGDAWSGAADIARELEALAATGHAPHTRATDLAITRPETAAAAAGAARTVRVTIRPDAMMRGARGMLALRKAESLGAVSALVPPMAHLEREDFDGRLAFRLVSPADDATVTAALATVGDVTQVEIEAATGAAPEQVSRRSGRQIRVDLARLDALMKQVGELVVARNRLAALTAGTGDDELAAVAERVARLTTEMQGEILQARLTPVGEVFERFPRLVRDVARELGKDVKLVTEGDAIELDRSVLDEIGDPLVHLLRNALDHGIEPGEIREAAGKPRAGRVTISAARERNSVAIRIADDGRGIDRDRVLAKARREGLVEPGVETLSDDLLLRVLARPGFSTADRVSEVSGRGVGVDAALTRIRALGGTLELRTDAGQGTTWTLRVPLTLAIVRALLTGVGDECYAIPLAYVAETVEFAPQAVTAMRDREALLVHDRVVPTVHARQLFRVPSGAAPARRPAVILEIGDRRAALVVDTLLGQYDIVVEPFDAPAGLPPFFSGATILADGAPALILDAAALT